MASVIKKTTFDDLYNTFHSVMKRIDEAFIKIKNDNKGKKIYEGFDNYKDFLRYVESTAIKETSKEIGLTIDSVRERWRTLNLPLPVYDALETGKVSFSKAKLLSGLNLNPESEKDQEATQKLVESLKSNISVKSLKDVIEKETKGLWNESTVIMDIYASQHGINSKTVC